MPPSYRVFIGAPSIHELANDPKTYSWHTTSSTSASSSTKDADAAVVVPTVTRTQSSRGGVSASMNMNMSIGVSMGIGMSMNKSARHSQSFVLPRATLAEASRRISLIYRDLVMSGSDGGGEEDEGLAGGRGVLDEEDEEEEREKEGDSGAWASGVYEATDAQDDASSEGELIPGLDFNVTKSVEVSVFRGIEQTTLISWPPSNSRLREDDDADETRDSENTNNSRSFTAPSFLLDNTTDGTRSQIVPGAGDASNPHSTRTSQFAGTQTQALESQSFGAYSDASSIARFPAFHFSLHALTPLAVLAGANHPAAASKPKQPAVGWHGPGGPPAPRRPAAHGPGPARNVKVNLLLAVLEVDGPDTVRLKRGADAGAQVAVLKLILGDEAGNVARLTAWRETAEAWAGGERTEVKRGDIVHIENVTVTHGDAPNGSGPTLLLLSASPFLKSKLTICYRTMPAIPQDARLRPDLRLGISEPSVRRVAGVVEWFERMAGLG